MTHSEFLSSLIHSVHTVGAGATLDELRRTRPEIVDGEYHDTLATYYVWAVDRLISADLSDVAIHWHPLTDRFSPLSWWPAERLQQRDAFDHFVPSTLVQLGEPEPVEPHQFAVAA